MRKQDELKSLTLLGEHKTTYPTDYAPEMLETFENKHPENEYLVTLNCPEFTSLCPKTGQPDFAKIVISYIPRERMVVKVPPFIEHILTVPTLTSPP